MVVGSDGVCRARANCNKHALYAVVTSVCLPTVAMAFGRVGRRYARRERERELLKRCEQHGKHACVVAGAEGDVRSVCAQEAIKISKLWVGWTKGG